MKREWLPIVLATAIFAGLSLWAAAASPGFLEADACTHYQYARFALGEEHYLVNVWGRPFATALYAIPATLAGRMGVRVTSLICALLIATIAWRIARDQNYRWPALAFIFTLAQPLLFLHSFSELTELPFALLLVMAFWAYRRRQFLVMTILAALTPTARPEGFGILLLALLALIAHRSPEPSPHPFPGVPGEGEQTHRASCQFLIAAIPLSILAVHTLLYWLGRMASNGELRYLLIVAPFWALLAAKGWEWTFDRF